MKFAVLLSVLAFIFSRAGALRAEFVTRTRTGSRLMMVKGETNVRPGTMVASLAICFGLFGSSPIVLPAQAVNLEAGQLFEKAGTMIDNALIQYKDAEGDWKTVSKAIYENNNIILKSCNSLQVLIKDVASLQTVLSDLAVADEAAKGAIAAENEVLRETAAAKYEAAEKSSAALARPSVTSDLFLKAQNEASVLAHNEQTLKTLTDIVSSDFAYMQRGDVVLKGVSGISDRASEIQTSQVTGLSDMIQGLAANEKACREKLNDCNEDGKQGMDQFKKGMQTVLTAQDKFSKLKKDLGADVSNIKSLSQDISKATDRTKALLDEQSQWEDLSKLKVRQAKGVVKQTYEKLSTTLRSTNSFADKITSVNDLLGNGKDVPKTKDVSEQLKKTLTKIEKAEKTSKDAENLLKKAISQGEKEAKSYLKYSKTSVPASAIATPATTTTATTKTVAASASKAVTAKSPAATATAAPATSSTTSQSYSGGLRKPLPPIPAAALAQ